MEDPARSSLFGFCVAVVLYTAVALLRVALRGAHGVQKVEAEVSDYYIAAELETTSRGMMIAIPEQPWGVFGKMSLEEFAAVMLFLAGKVQLRQFQKHPRGRKKPPPKRAFDPKHPPVSTFRLLQTRKLISPANQLRKRGNTRV